MKRVALLPAAYLLDCVAGDPEWFPHPVRAMGHAITQGERWLRAADDSAAVEMVSGAVLTAGVVVSSYVATHTMVRLAYRQSRLLGCAVEILLAWTCLAARNLEQEAQAVQAALERGDLALARKRLARIVGRDTQELDASEISRALIETLAESASDGVMAPVLYLALGGVPLAMAYKAVNTLDSMIGHRDERYLYFGRVAARLDDVANVVPSRVTALSVVGAAMLSKEASARDAWRTWLRDGAKHKSPNAGQPEAAMAGALRVRLGGENTYAGERIASPLLGEEFAAATPRKARLGIELTTRVALLGVAAGVAIAFALRRRRA